MPQAFEFHKNLLFIGSGNIAYAVAFGFVSSGAVPSKNITIYNRNSAKFEKFEKIGINTSLDLYTASEQADIIFLAVKPNVVSAVMQELSEIDGLLDRVLVISFAASVSVEHIINAAGRDVNVIRTMPSTPILIGEGVLSVARNDRIKSSDFESFCRLMSSVAYVAVVNEEEMNPLISVHGSSPAYVYLFIKAMLDAAIKQGINEKNALPLILKTIKGSVSMVENASESIDTLIKNVASPNGTTLAALNSFAADDFCGVVERAMEACTKRANEISEEL